MSEKGSRECFLDLLRIIACFFVIVNHTNSTIFLHNTPDSIRWFFSITYFFMSKTAVPIFIMISGYLLLNRIDTWKKAFAKFYRIAVVLICCALIYSLYNNIYVNSNSSLSAIYDTFIGFYRKSPSTAFWYLYAYLGILLMLPFLQKMTKMMDKKDYYVFFTISGLFFSVIPILRHYFEDITYESRFYIPLFGGYVCMLLIGQYISKYGIKKTKIGFFVALATFVLMVGLNVTLTYLEYSKSSTSYLFLDNVMFLPIVIEALCLFYMATFVKLGNKAAKIISYIGSCTFGIYLISDMSIDFLEPIFISLSDSIHPILAVVLFEIIVFVIGFIITVPLKKIPIIKKFL